MNDKIIVRNKLPGMSTEDLIEKANVGHSQMDMLQKKRVQVAAQVGAALIELKYRAGHGNWGQFVEDSLLIGMRQVQRYIQFARAFESNTTLKSYLEDAPSIESALPMLDAPPEPLLLMDVEELNRPASDDSGITDETVLEIRQTHRRNVFQLNSMRIGLWKIRYHLHAMDRDDLIESWDYLNNPLDETVDADVPEVVRNRLIEYVDDIDVQIEVRGLEPDEVMDMKTEEFSRILETAV